MAELPEVETIRRELEREAVGKRVKAVEVPGPKAVRRHKTKKQFTDALEGAKLDAVERIGLHLAIRLDTGGRLVVLLGPTGRLIRAAGKEEQPKGTQAVLTFTQHGQLRLVDPKGVSEIFVVSSEEALAAEAPELIGLGFDPVEEPISWGDFARLLLGRGIALKSALIDQTIVAGIGNVYADEILFASGLRHDRLPSSLSTMELRRLYRSVVEVLHDAVKYRGSTLADGSYTDLHGKPGEYQDQLKVYERDKQPCRRCRSDIEKTKFAGQVTYFCPRCQI